MKRILIAIGLLIGALPVLAQKDLGGELSIGPRFGGSIGGSLKKHFSGNGGAFELMGTNSLDNVIKGFTLSAYGEKLAPLRGKGQFSAFLGLGMNANFKDQTKIGAGTILGFDWRPRLVPLTLQVDWAPSYYFVNSNRFIVSNAAFTIRYILNRNRDKRQPREPRNTPAPPANNLP